MLQSNSKHMWSHNGVRWVDVDFHTRPEINGGSAAYWLKQNGIEGDNRKWLTEWGHEEGSTRTGVRGGCCSSSAAVDANTWGQAFTLSYFYQEVCDLTHPNAKGLAACNAVSAALAGNRCSANILLGIIPEVSSTYQNDTNGYSKEYMTDGNKQHTTNTLGSAGSGYWHSLGGLTGKTAWAKVVFKERSSVHQVRLTNRCDQNGDRISGAKVFIGQSDSNDERQCGGSIPPTSLCSDAVVICEIVGDYIIVRQSPGIILQIVELQAYGSAVPTKLSFADVTSPEECATLVAGDGGCAGNTATFQYNAGTGACHCVPQDCPRFRYEHNERVILNSLASEDASWTIYNRFDLTATPSKRYHFEHKAPTARVDAAGAWVAAEGYGGWDGMPAVVAEPPLSATEVSEWTMKILYTPAELENSWHNLAFNLFHFGIFVGKDLPITDMNTRKRQEDAQNSDCMYGKSYPLCKSYFWDGSYMLSDPDKLVVGNGAGGNTYEYWEMPYGMESMGSDKSKWKYTPMYQTGDEVRFRFDPAVGHCSIVVVRGNVTYFAGAFMLKTKHVGKPVRISMFIYNQGSNGNNGAVMITDTPKAPPCDPSHPNAKGTAACNAISVALAGKRCTGSSTAAVTGSTDSGALAASPEECAALVAGDGGCAGNTATFQYNAVSGACQCVPQQCLPSQVENSDDDWSIYNRFDVTAVPSHTYSFKHKTPSALLGAGGAWASAKATQSFVTLVAEPALPIAEVSEWAIKLLYTPPSPIWAFGIFVGDELPVKPSMNLLKRDPDTGQPYCSYGDDYPNCLSYSWDGTYLLYRDGDVLFGDGKFECSDKRGCYSYLYNDGTLGPPNEARMYSPFIMESQGNTFSNRAKPAYLTGDEIRFRFDPAIGRCTMLVLRGDETFNAGAFTLKSEHLGKPVRIHVYGNDGDWSKRGAVMIADVAPPTVADIPNNDGAKPVVGLLARVGSATKADSAFWGAACQRLPPTTQYIIVLMGAVLDYFKPIDGETSFCDMLTSNDKHLWSPNGVDWQQPTYANATQGSGKVLGGSSDAWPRDKVGNDERDLLSMWGDMDGAKLGGCCSRSKKVASTTGHNGGTDTWAQDFDMWYVDLKTSTTTSTTIATNAETANPTPATTTTTANGTPDAGDDPTQVGLGGTGTGDKITDDDDDNDDDGTTEESERAKSNGGAIAGGIIAALILIAILGYVVWRKYGTPEEPYRKSSTFDAQLALFVASGLIDPEDDAPGGAAAAVAATSAQSETNKGSGGAGASDAELDTNEYLAPTPIKSVSNPVFDAQNEYTDFDEGANAEAAVAAESGESNAGAAANPPAHDLASGKSNEAAATPPNPDLASGTSNEAASPVKLDLASGMSGGGKEEAFDGFGESADDGYLHVQSGTADSLREMAETHSALKSVDEKKGSTSDAAAAARKVPLVVARSTVFELEKLGEGHFGTVSKGLLDQSSIGGAPECLVAIKAVKSSAPAIETTKLMEEAVLMAQVSGHENIVSVVGIVTGDDGGPVMLLVTYCEHGSLDHYLKKRAGEPPQWKADICIGVARGMAHLSNCGFVHRDLAARNILIDSRKRPRVADFGMSRDGGDAGDDDDNVYQGSNGGALPIRWTAPESFMTHTFNTASDVWSFGVLLLEV